jgi:hypothetical protein
MRTCQDSGESHLSHPSHAEFPETGDSRGMTRKSEKSSYRMPGEPDTRIGVTP